MKYTIGQDTVHEFILDLPIEDIMNHMNRLEELKAGQYTGLNKRSNYGGFQSFEYPFRQHKTHTFAPLNDIFDTISNLIEENFDDRYEYILNNYWFNINFPGSYNKLHDHLTPYKNQQGISGTFYVHVPTNSGNITFVCEEEDTRLEVISSANRVLLFPSYLLHEVSENLTQSNRYSVAFNYDMILKPGSKSTL